MFFPKHQSRKDDDMQFTIDRGSIGIAVGYGLFWRGLHLGPRWFWFRMPMVGGVQWIWNLAPPACRSRRSRISMTF